MEERINPLKVVGIVLASILGFLLLFGFKTVGTGERAVLVTRGEVTGKLFEEGWYVITPFVQSLRYFDVKSQLDTVKAEAASADLQDVSVELAVQFRIEGDKVADIARTIGTERQLKEKIIDPAVQETTKAATARFVVADIIQKRPAVKLAIEEGLITRLSAYGVVLEELSIKNIEFSEVFTNAIEQKQVAEQKKLQAKFQADAVIAEAQGKAKEQELLQKALSKTPELLTRLWIEKWDGHLPTYMGSGTPLLNLGLVK